MSKTRKDRQTRFRIIKNSLIKKILDCYTDKIAGKRKDRELSRLMRTRLKRIVKKEIREELGDVEDEK